jgi:predicted membrane protein
MIEALFWGIFIIISTSITAIVVVIGIYYLFTKNKKVSKKGEKYTLEKQQEIK